MPEITNLSALIKELTPQINDGEFVFVTVKDTDTVNRSEVLCEFKEQEGITMVVEQKVADHLHLSYDYVFSWITLKVRSSLSAVGLTAAFSSELARHDISCNVVAGYYHDHIFVNVEDTLRAIQVLNQLSENY